MKMRHVFLFIAAIFVATAVFVLPEETKAAGSSVKIGGVELVNDNAWHAYNSKKPTISGWTAGKYKLTKDRATLYLNGFKYSGKKRGISGNGALKIVTTGANTITTTDARGIWLENADEEKKNLTFAAGSATSTLTVKSTNAYALGTNSLTKGAGTLNITGNATCEGTVSSSAGTLKVTGRIDDAANYKITGGTVTVGGDLTIDGTGTISGGTTTVGDYSGASKTNITAGVFKSNADIFSDAITASGGTMTAVKKMTCDNMTVSGATITTQNGNIDVDEKLTLSSGTLKSNKHINTATMIASGGTLTAAGSILCTNITVSGAAVIKGNWLDYDGTATISGGNTTIGSMGSAEGNKLNITAGTLKSDGDICADIITASGGTMTASTDITCNSMTVSGATVTAQKAGVWIFGNLTVSKGSLTGISQETGTCISVSGNATVKGGTVNGKEMKYEKNLTVKGGKVNGGTVNVSDTATISAGEIDLSSTWSTALSSGSLKVTGGKIRAKSNGEYGVSSGHFTMTDGLVYASSNLGKAFIARGSNISNDIWLSLPNDGYFSDSKIHVFDKNGNSAKEVELKKMSSVSIKQNPQTKYFVGDVFDPTGLVMKVAFADGTENELSYSGDRKGMFTFDRDLSEPLAVEDVSVTVNVLNGSRRIGLSVNNLAAPVVTGTSDVDTATLCWDSVDGATYHEVYKKNIDNGEFEKIDEITSMSFTDEGLEPGKIYEYKVRAKRITTSGSTLIGPYSNIVELSVKLKNPELSLVNARYDSVELSWPAVKGAVNYAVYRLNDDNIFALYRVIGDTVFKDSNLITNKSYKYKVVALSDVVGLKSGDSNIITATTTFAGKPKLTVTNNKANYDLSWTEVGGATEYVVMRKDKGGSFEEITRTEDLTFRDTGASCHEEYTYKIIPRRVTAAGHWEASASAEVKSVPIIKDPEKAPENKEIQKVGKIGTIGQPSKGLMHIYFGKVKGATNYRIEYRKVSDKVWQKKWTGNKTKFTISKMKKGQLLEFRFAAFKTNKEGSLERSPYSNMSYRWYVATKGTVKGAKKSAVVRMKKVKGATGYEVLYSTKKSLLAKDNKMKTASARKAKAKIKGLKSKKNYYIKFRPIKKYKGKVYRGVLVTRKVKVK